jgi:hypothetical protein
MLAEFGDVGLMTGDVTINPSATCLVMTTEVCRILPVVHPALFLIKNPMVLDFTVNAVPRVRDHA